MKKTLDKLPYRSTLNDLEVSPRNLELISKFLAHMDGYVCETRIQKYKHSLTRFANLVEKDMDDLTYEEIRKAGGIINKSEFSVKTKRENG